MQHVALWELMKYKLHYFITCKEPWRATITFSFVLLEDKKTFVADLCSRVVICSGMQMIVMIGCLLDVTGEAEQPGDCVFVEFSFDAGTLKGQ